MHVAGLLAFDVNNKVQCLLQKQQEVCDAPSLIAGLDNVFDMTTPIMGRTDIIAASIRDAFGVRSEFLQVLQTILGVCQILLLVFCAWLCQDSC
jgi:hypothetical protein